MTTQNVTGCRFAVCVFHCMYVILYMCIEDEVVSLIVSSVFIISPLMVPTVHPTNLLEFYKDKTWRFTAVESN